MAQMWPSAFCRNNDCARSKTVPRTKFIVHGVWPSNYTGPEVKECIKDPDPAAKLEIGKIDPKFKRELGVCWPSLTSQTNEEFWSSEWKKHGTCSYFYNHITQTAYLKKAQEIWKLSDLYNTLKNSGIVPRNNVPYPIDEFIDPIKTHNPGYHVELQCVNGELQQIFLCFDVLGNNPEPCPSLGNCGNTVLWKGW